MAIEASCGSGLLGPATATVALVTYLGRSLGLANIRTDDEADHNAKKNPGDGRGKFGRRPTRIANVTLSRHELRSTKGGLRTVRPAANRDRRLRYAPSGMPGVQHVAGHRHGPMVPSPSGRYCRAKEIAPEVSSRRRERGPRQRSSGGTGRDDHRNDAGRLPGDVSERRRLPDTHRLTLHASPSRQSEQASCVPSARLARRQRQGERARLDRVSASASAGALLLC